MTDDLLNEAMSALHKRTAQEEAKAREKAETPKVTISNQPDTAAMRQALQDLRTVFSNVTASTVIAVQPNNTPTPTTADNSYTHFMGYLCEECDSIFRWEDHRTGKAKYMGCIGDSLTGNSDDECMYVKVDQDGVVEDVWYCNDGCFNHDKGMHPPQNEYFECNNCNEIYDTSSSAAKCCKE